MPNRNLDLRFIETLLDAVGSHLESAGSEASIVVVGGAALNLNRLVARTTEDVDVIAMWQDGRLRPPRFEQELADAVRRVARDFGLPEDWLNDMAGMQWRAGMPPTLVDDAVWLRFRSLHACVVGRKGLVALKLFAAADQGPRSVHAQDLEALAPTDEELAASVDWVETQDIAPEWPRIVQETVRHVVDRRTPRR